MSNFPEDPSKDAPDRRFPGGPVSPRVTGQLNDLRPSIHDPTKDLLLPADLPIDLWRNEKDTDRQILAAIASQGVESALLGIKLNNTSALAKQIMRGDLYEIDNALKAYASDVPERNPDNPRRPPQPSYKGGRVESIIPRATVDLSQIESILDSLRWFKYLRATLLEASVDDAVDLRAPWFTIDQPSSGASCVGHAVADLIERQRMVNFDRPSARFIWQAAKELDGDDRPTTMMAGAGTSIRAALALVTQFGYAFESEISSSNERLYQGDMVEFYQRIGQRKATAVLNLGNDSKHWMGWLLTGRPIVASLQVGDNFLATSGKDIRIQAEEDLNHTFLHAVLVLGYRFVEDKAPPGAPPRRPLPTDRKVRTLLYEEMGDQKLPVEYLVRNSAGKDWGDKGYAWLPQHVLMTQGLEGYGLLWSKDHPERDKGK